MSEQGNDMPTDDLESELTKLGELFDEMLNARRRMDEKKKNDLLSAIYPALNQIFAKITHEFVATERLAKSILCVLFAVSFSKKIYTECTEEFRIYSKTQYEIFTKSLYGELTETLKNVLVKNSPNVAFYQSLLLSSILKASLRDDCHDTGSNSNWICSSSVYDDFTEVFRYTSRWLLACKKKCYLPDPQRDRDYFCLMLLNTIGTINKLSTEYNDHHSQGPRLVFPSLLLDQYCIQKEEQLKLFSEKGMFSRKYATDETVTFECEEIVHAVHDPEDILDYFEQKKGKWFLVLKGQHSVDYPGPNLVWFGVTPPPPEKLNGKVGNFFDEPHKNRYGPLLLKVKTKALMALKPLNMNNDGADQTDGKSSDENSGEIGTVKVATSPDLEEKEEPDCVGFKAMGTRIYKTERSHTTIVDCFGGYFPQPPSPSDSYYESGNPFKDVKISKLEYNNGDWYPSAWDHPEFALIDPGEGILIPLENDNLVIDFKEHEYCVYAAKNQKLRFNGEACPLRVDVMEAKNSTLKVLNGAEKEGNNPKKDVLSMLKTLIAGNPIQKIDSNVEDEVSTAVGLISSSTIS